MIKILILLTFHGFTMSIDAEKMYGITDIESCKKYLPEVEKEYRYLEIIGATCIAGDINEKTQKT